MRVVATAGHVDHGKSALVAALTGKHPDRLKEEQIREMTIDLGFAWFELPGGEEIGIIDVPGHIDFIENMLAGMGGIDAVMLVIAADEGIMPQTREHLDIIDLLEINSGVVVLNKVDLVNDPTWLDLVEEEIKEEVSNTSLAGCPMIRFSSKTGEGIDELRKFLGDLAIKNKPQSAFLSPRLAIDRVFSIAGFGTVVTGTLLNGSFRVGDEVEISPSEIRTRIRGIQTHNKKVETAQPGSRTALNLSGVEKADIRRGDVICKPGQVKATNRMDVSVRLISRAGVSIHHNDFVKLFVGTAVRNARIRLLEKNVLNPGDEGLLQIETEESISVRDGDHYIIRKASPSITLGGGKVLDMHPSGRYKLKDVNKIGGLMRKFTGDSGQLILAELQTLKTVNQLVKRLTLEETEVEKRLNLLLGENAIVSVPASNTENIKAFIRSDIWTSLMERVISVLDEKHTRYPHRKGFRIDELEGTVSQSGVPLRVVLDSLVSQGRISESHHLIHLREVKPVYSPLQEKNKTQLWGMIDAAPFSPPDPQRMREILGLDLYNALVEGGDLVKVSDDVVFRESEILEMKKYVEQQFTNGQTITVAGFRDRFSTSRKYALAFLEYLDRQKITRRLGDERVPY